MKNKQIMTAVLLAISVSAGVAGANATAMYGSRPNIVLVLTDDQGMGDLSCMGNQVVKTPNNLQLKEKGIPEWAPEEL